MAVTCTLLPIVFVIDFNTLNNHALLSRGVGEIQN